MPTFRNITDDVFSTQRITPSGAIHEQILLFDNYGTASPIQPLESMGAVKLFQMLICFLMQGEIKLLVNGEIIILSGGQTLTIMPDSEVKILSYTPDYKYLIFVIYPDLLHLTCKDIYLNFDKTTFGQGYMLATCNEEQMSIYQILYSELKKECYRNEYEYKMLAAKSYFNALLINTLNLYEITKNIDIDPHSRQYDVYQKFLEALNLHSKRERTVKYYADLLNISPKYLSFVSLQYSSKNASQWISEYVVINAKLLMNTHHLTAAETAEMLNFPTLNSFNRFFKRASGLSPKEFIRSLKNNNNQK